MYRQLLPLLLLAADASFAQEAPLGFTGLLGGWELHQGVGGAWLKAISDSQSRKSYQSLVSTTATPMSPGSRAAVGAARAKDYSFLAHPVCNYTSCCSTRTTASVARRAILSAASVGAAVPPAALACGPTPLSAAAPSAPCHPPLDGQPLLQGLQTRLQLSLHSLHRKLSSLGSITPLAWVARLQQMYQQRERLLALPPAALLEPRNEQQQEEPEPAKEAVAEAGAVLASTGVDATTTGAVVGEQSADGDSLVPAEVEAEVQPLASPRAASPPASDDTASVCISRGMSEVEDEAAPQALTVSASGQEEEEQRQDRNELPAVVAAPEEQQQDRTGLAAEQQQAGREWAAVAEEQQQAPAPTLAAAGREEQQQHNTQPESEVAVEKRQLATTVSTAGAGGAEVEGLLAGAGVEELLAEHLAARAAAAAAAAVAAVAAVEQQLLPASRDPVIAAVAAVVVEEAQQAASAAVVEATEAAAAAQEAQAAAAQEAQWGSVLGGEHRQDGAGQDGAGQDGGAGAGCQRSSSSSSVVGGSSSSSSVVGGGSSSVVGGSSSVVGGGSSSSSVVGGGSSSSSVVGGGSSSSSLWTAGDPPAAWCACQPRERQWTNGTNGWRKLEGLWGMVDFFPPYARDQDYEVEASPLLAEQLMTLFAAALFMSGMHILAASTACRQVARYCATLEAQHRDHSQQVDQLRDQHTTLVSELLNVYDSLQRQLSAAGTEAARQRAARAAALSLASGLQRGRAAAAVHVAERVPELQRCQAALAGALADSLRQWHARGEALTAALAQSRRGLARVARTAAAEQAAAAERLRQQRAEAERDRAAAAEAHERELAAVRRRLEEELAEERRRHSATSEAARVQRVRATVALRELRRRHGRNVASWLAMRSSVALQMTELAERAGRLAAEHRSSLEEARGAVELHRARVATTQQQLAEQVAVVVETRRTNSELLDLLGDKDCDIVQLDGELAVARAGLDSQRRQCDDLQRALTATEESLVSSRREAAELEAQLLGAQAAASSSEARAAQLSAANQLLDQQAKEFTDMAGTLAQLQDTFVGPAQAHAAAQERSMAAEREAAAAAAAERDARLAEAAEALAEARREVDASQRARSELVEKLDRRERELHALQAELAEQARREEEGVENTLAAARMCDRDNETVLQQLLGPIAGMPLPLPADTKAYLAAVSTPGSAAGLLSGAGALATPGSSYSGGGGAAGSSSASGVRGVGTFAFGGSGRK